MIFAIFPPILSAKQYPFIVMNSKHPAHKSLSRDVSITGVSASTHNLTFRAPFSISYSTTWQAPVVFVHLDTDTGIAGYGCAAPDAEVSGESIQDVYAAAQHMQTAFFNKPLNTVEDIRYYHERLAKRFPHFPSLRAALEMALFDIVGKSHKLPLGELL